MYPTIFGNFFVPRNLTIQFPARFFFKEIFRSRAGGGISFTSAVSSELAYAFGIPG